MPHRGDDGRRADRRARRGGRGEVRLVAFGGARLVFGFNQQVMLCVIGGAALTRTQSKHYSRTSVASAPLPLVVSWSNHERRLVLRRAQDERSADPTPLSD